MIKGVIQNLNMGQMIIAVELYKRICFGSIFRIKDLIIVMVL